MWRRASGRSHDNENGHQCDGVAPDKFDLQRVIVTRGHFMPLRRDPKRRIFPCLKVIASPRGSVSFMVTTCALTQIASRLLSPARAEESGASRAPGHPRLPS